MKTELEILNERIAELEKKAEIAANESKERRKQLESQSRLLKENIETVQQSFQKVGEAEQKLNEEKSKIENNRRIKMERDIRSIHDNLVMKIDQFNNKSSNSGSGTDYLSVFKATNDLKNALLGVVSDHFSSNSAEELKQKAAVCESIIQSAITTKETYHRNRYFRTTGKSLQALKGLNDIVREISKLDISNISPDDGGLNFNKPEINMTMS